MAHKNFWQNNGLIEKIYHDKLKYGLKREGSEKVTNKKSFNVPFGDIKIPRL
jgi:hypothetical protein